MKNMSTKSTCGTTGREDAAGLSEGPELISGDLSDAILTRPGQNLIETVRSGRTGVVVGDTIPLAIHLSDHHS